MQRAAVCLASHDPQCEYCSTLGCMSTSDPSYCSGYFYSVPSSCPNYLCECGVAQHSRAAAGRRGALPC